VGAARAARLATNLAADFQEALLSEVHGFAGQSLESSAPLLERKDGKIILTAVERALKSAGAIHPRVVTLVDTLAAWTDPSAAPAPPLDRPSEERAYSEAVDALLSARAFPSAPHVQQEAVLLKRIEAALQSRVAAWGGSADAEPLAGLRPAAAQEHLAMTLLDLVRQRADEGAARALSGFLDRQAHAGAWGLVVAIWSGLTDIEAGAGQADPGIRDLCRKARMQHWSPENLPRITEAILAHGVDRTEGLKEILKAVGATHAERLVERLAAEEQPGQDETLLGLAVDLKEHALPHVLRLLDDDRVEVVRRMLAVLERMKEQSALRKIETLLSRPETDVKTEALGVLFRLRSPRALMLLLRMMADEDLQVSLAGIAAARLSSHTHVVRALLEIVRAPRWFRRSFDLDRKLEAVRSLAAIGRRDALPTLFRLDTARALFHARAARQLRLEIFRSLEHYEPEKIAAIIRWGRKSKDQDLVAICQALERRRPPAGEPAPSPQPEGPPA
jgi:HEAT repeat protein